MQCLVEGNDGFYRTIGMDSKIENDLQGRQSHGVVGQMDLNNR